MENVETNPIKEPENALPEQEQAMESTDMALLKQIEVLQSDLFNQKNIALRALADLDNYRKRALKEKEDLRAWATASLVEALLPVIDNLELGLQSASSQAEAASIVQGFQLVYEQFLNTLKNSGLVTIMPQGELFDPNAQECIAHMPDETILENYVIQVVRKGYKLGEKLIRPASVIVSSGLANSATT